jgi:hypothetical protein
MMTMSNAGTENKTQRVIDDVTKVWKLPDRDDLLDDCINYVAKNYSHSYEIKDLIITFLLNKCADALSTADLREMAAIDNMQYEDGIKPERHGFLTYEEATQGK